MLKKLIRSAFPPIPENPDRRRALKTIGVAGVATVLTAHEAQAGWFDDLIDAITPPEAEESSGKSKSRPKRTLSEAEKRDIAAQVSKEKRTSLKPGEGAKTSLQAWTKPKRQVQTLILKRAAMEWHIDVRDLTKVNWETFKEATRDYGHKGDAPPNDLFEAHKAIMLGQLVNYAETFAHEKQTSFIIGVRSCYRTPEHQRAIVTRQRIREAEGGERAGSRVTSEHCDFLAWDLDLSEEAVNMDIGFATSTLMRCQSGRYPDEGDLFFHSGNSGNFKFWSKSDSRTTHLARNNKLVVNTFLKTRPARKTKDPLPAKPQPEPHIVEKLPAPEQPAPQFARAEMNSPQPVKPHVINAKQAPIQPPAPQPAVRPATSLSSPKVETSAIDKTIEEAHQMLQDIQSARQKTSQSITALEELVKKMEASSPGASLTTGSIPTR